MHGLNNNTIYLKRPDKYINTCSNAMLSIDTNKNEFRDLLDTLHTNILNNSLFGNTLNTALTEKNYIRVIASQRKSMCIHIKSQDNFKW